MLSAKEFQLLRFLVEHADMILSRDQLLNEVWGYDALPSTALWMCTLPGYGKNWNRIIVSLNIL